MVSETPLELLLSTAVERVLELQDSGVSTPVVIIDGPSASGKTTFAEKLQNQLFKLGETLPRVVHMDDLYSGWEGLQDGHDYLLRYLLNPTSSGKKASWQEFNWQLGERDRWREFEGGTPLIVEGCGSLSQATAPLAHLKIWLSAAEPLRKQRWSSREGAAHDLWWPIWAAQELDFYARERSQELSDYQANTERD